MLWRECYCYNDHHHHNYIFILLIGISDTHMSENQSDSSGHWIKMKNDKRACLKYNTP